MKSGCQRWANPQPESLIGKWFKKTARRGNCRDEPLVELETDKVTVEVPAPAAGVMGEILVQEGDTVEVGALLGTVAEGGGAHRQNRLHRQNRPQLASLLKRHRQRPPVRRRLQPHLPLPRCWRNRLCLLTRSRARVSGVRRLKGDVLEALEKGAKAPARTGRAGSVFG